MKGNSNRVVVLLIGVLAPILVIITRLTWAGAAPDPLPTHWNAAGHVNSTTAASPLFWWTLVISAGLALAGAGIVFRRRSPETGRLLASMLVGGAWQVGAIYVMSVGLSRNAETAQSVALPWFAVVLLVGIPLAVAVLIWFLLPMSPVPPQQLPHSTVQLGQSEKVVWISHAHSKPIRFIATALMVVALIMVVFSPTWAVILFPVAVLLVATSEVAVRVDREGLHTMWGPVGWPRQVIHLGAIAAVHAELIHPMQWGGFGYRITSKGRAANIRTGPGLVVRRANGNTYVVTVDDAARGADVLNALLSRARQSAD